MIRWLLYLIPSLLSTVLCYLTNWFVVLFADRDGELHGVLHLWQTYDNSCNPSDIKHIMPSWLLYDWDAHYVEYEDTTKYLQDVTKMRWYTTCINDDWTLWERFQRYACRVLWLTRNNAYGWAFYALGITATPFLDIKESEHTISVKDRNSDAWMYKNDAPICSIFGYTIKWCNFLGWKLDTDAEVDTRCMIANRIAVRFEREA